MMATFAINNSPLLGILLSLLFSTQFSTGQYYLENKECAVFHTEENFTGEGFTLRDRDQSVHLEEDQRSSDSGWNVTGSISVMSGCVLDICTEMYLTGNCQKLLHGEYPTLTDLNLVNITSTACNCFKDCKCSDVFMKKSSCARAYLRGGCKTCNSLYTDLTLGSQPDFSDDFNGKVEAFRIRKGCQLTLYSEEDFEGDGEVLDSEIVEDYSGEFQSYKCECDDSQFVPREKPPRPASYPPLIDIPEKLDYVIKMLSNKTFSNHPGLRDAHKSLMKKRSSKNAYILLLGTTGAGKSSAINLLFDNPNVTKVGDHLSTTTDIHEFRIPVPVDEMGVANSELRVIDTPGLGDTRGIAQDASFLSTLDAYLSTHEELKDRIPNVVLIFHKFSDNRFSGEGSLYVQMLRGLDSIREKITDENYSNVIFVLSHFCSETDKVKTRPSSKLKKFKAVIEDYSLFPKPIMITVAENKAADHSLPMVNGFFRLPNNEYYPKNLFEKMELVTEKGGDPMGLAVLRSAFRDSADFNVSHHNFALRKKSAKFDHYFRIISNAFFAINETEVSRQLQQTWDNKLDNKLKADFPSTLPYLQKALSLRNVNTKEDVPKTTRDIIKLLASIKNDGATRELLKRALNIEAPPFPQTTIAGYGYNVFSDVHLSKSPFKLGEGKGSDIGFSVPKTLTCNLDPGTKRHFETLSRQEYLEHRLSSLNVGHEGNISLDSFTGVVKPGYNIKEVAFQEDGCTLTGSQEFRLFEFDLNTKQELTEEFQETVRSLPAFNETEHETVGQWKKFFDDYGTHVVKSIYGGGVIEIRLSSNKPYDSTLHQKMFDLVRFAEDMSFIVVDGEDDEEDPQDDDGDGSGNGTRRKTVLPEGIDHSLTFRGGDPAYHTSDLTKMTVEDASKLLTDWKKSLKFSPVILTTEMRLLPISHFVTKKLGQNYSSEIDRATSLLFKSELKYSPPTKDFSPGGAREDTQLANEKLKIQAELQAQLETISAQLQMQQLKLEERKIEAEENRRKHEKDLIESKQAHDATILEMQNNAASSQNAFQKDMEKIRTDHDARLKELEGDHTVRLKEITESEARKTREFAQQIELERERIRANACSFRLFGACVVSG